jgi:subtilisin family serine protease
MGARKGILGAAAVALLCAVAPATAIAPPSDPQYPNQNALKIIRQPQALAALGSFALADVRVGVFDTGLDLDHPEFAGRLVDVPASTTVHDSTGSHAVGPGAHGWDFLGNAHNGQLTPTTPDNDPSDPTDGTSHGTAVSGILGAAHNNGNAGAGVAPNARFVAIRSCWDDDQCYQSIQPDAVSFAKALHVQVVSMSWLADPTDFANDGYKDAIQNAPQILFVAIPSGNGGATDAQPDAANRAPCNFNPPGDNVICVTTSSPTDGLDCGDFGSSLVDLAVPTQQNIFTQNGGGFGTTGCATSFAAPTLAGAATVLFGIDPTATPSEVKKALIDSARPAAAWQGKSVSGGILDLEAAVKLFAQRRNITLTPDTGGPGPTPTPTPGPGTKDTKKPTLTLGLAGARIKARKGLGLRATLSEPSTLLVSIRRRLSGRRVRGHCVAPTRANRRKPKCTRIATKRALTIRGLLLGLNRRTVALKGSNGKLLPPGAYEVATIARDLAGNRSSTRTTRFTILSP